MAFVDSTPSNSVINSSSPYLSIYNSSNIREQHTYIMLSLRSSKLMLAKKRKWDDQTPEKAADYKKTSHLDFDVENDTPLPLEWQRCLDIKSGQIYFYNTKTQKRALADPRSNPETLNPPHMSLDLKLNLPCQSSTTNQVQKSTNHHTSPYSGNIQFLNLSTTCSKNGKPVTRSPSWLTFDHEGEEQEMVTAVCKKCYMLVMMCKSSPACPNCKFVHPSEPGSANPFNQRCSLTLQ